MSPIVMAAIALITYASRAAALALLPRPSGRFAAVLARVPTPIFASLATLSLVIDDRSFAGGPILCAALGALSMTPKRSLPLCLIGGVVGYALGELIL